MEHPSEIRGRLRRALCHLGRKAGTVYHLARDQYGGLSEARAMLGQVAGYPYEKASRTGSIVIALPGQLSDADQNGEYLMILYGCRAGSDMNAHYDPPEAKRDDILVLDAGHEYRITDVRDAFGIYQIYGLKEL